MQVSSILCCCDASQMTKRMSKLQITLQCSCVAPDNDNELSEDENRDSDTDSNTTSMCISVDGGVKSLLSVLRCPPLSSNKEE